MFREQLFVIAKKKKKKHNWGENDYDEKNG